MATLAPPDSPSPSRPFKRRTRSFARKCERCCCAIATYFPLTFVYGLTTWAIWVEASLGFTPSKHATTGITTSLLGIILYILLNASYTVAVFTDPGSPVDTPASRTSRHGYSHLPTTEPRTNIDPSITSITVSSTGAPRFCKKCLSPKPDRAHHCSTCKRCVLKMDHHCPWLATCVGLHNYKAFLLFLIYTSVFCWVCLGVTSEWIWAEVLSDEQYLETLMPINVVMLAVIAGIVGLVLSGFTAWHISLAFRGITTIECLEKTRYLSPMRKAHQQQLLRQQNPATNEDEYRDTYDRRSSADVSGFITNTLHKAGEELLTIHANAIPGATRLEEGEERFSPTPNKHQAYRTSPVSPNPSQHMTPAQASLARHAQQHPPNHHRSPASREASSERRRYLEYLDEEYAPKLPHAFDLGRRKNLIHLFGPNPWFWFLPVCNTSGDGWRWEVSDKWLRARDRVAEERRQEEERIGIHSDYNDGHAHGRGAGGGHDGAGRFYYESDRDRDYEHEHGYGSRYQPYDDCDYDSNHHHHQQSHPNSTFTPEDLTRRPSEAGSGLSMHTLNSQHQRHGNGNGNGTTMSTSKKTRPDKPPSSQHSRSHTSTSTRQQRHRHHTELHRADTGEVESFQVSGSEDGGDSDSERTDSEGNDDWDGKIVNANGHGHGGGGQDQDTSAKGWTRW